MIIKTVRILCVLALIMSVTPKGNARADTLTQVIVSEEISQSLPVTLHFDNNNMTQELWSITQWYDVEQFDPELGTLTAVGIESSLVPLPEFEILHTEFVGPDPFPFLFTLDNMLNIDIGLIAWVTNWPVSFTPPPSFPGDATPVDFPVLPLSGSVDYPDDLSPFVGDGLFPLNATWSGQLLVQSLIGAPVWVVDILTPILPDEVAATLTLSFHYEYDPAIPPQPVPEPATLLLLGSGLIGLAAFRRKFKKG